MYPYALIDSCIHTNLLSQFPSFLPPSLATNTGQHMLSLTFGLVGTLSWNTGSCLARYSEVSFWWGPGPLPNDPKDMITRLVELLPGVFHGSKTRTIEIRCLNLSLLLVFFTWGEMHKLTQLHSSLHDAIFRNHMSSLLISNYYRNSNPCSIR